MSDLIFDSERAAKREEKKKGLRRLLIPLGILLLLIIIVVIVALIVSGSRVKKNTGGENTPYPYSWYVKKDGTISLSIDHSASPDHSWNFKESDNSSLMSVEKDEKQKDKNATSFTIRPLDAGRALQTFELKSDLNPSIVPYELMLFTEVVTKEDGFTTEFLGTSVKPVKTSEMGGDNDFSYSIMQDDKLITMRVDYDPSMGGTLNILPGEEATAYDMEWSCTADGDMVSIQGITFSRGRVTIRLAAGEVPGTGTVTLRNESFGAEFVLSCSVWDNGDIKVDSHELKRFETE